MWSNGSDLASWVDNWADHQPDALAIEFEGVTTNYKQLSRRIASIASWLHLHKVEMGDRVAWLGPNHPLAIELLLACSRLGVIFLPLNSRLLSSEHRWILQDAEPKLLITHEDFHEHGKEAAEEIPVLLLDEVSQSEPIEVAPRVGGPDDPVLLAYTSGTTGTPKGALLCQSALAANAVNGAHAHDLTSNDRFLTFLPLFHVGGLNIQTLPALMGGASVLLHNSFDPGQWLEDVERWQPTWSLFVPATLTAVSNHPAFMQADLSSLKGLMAGSSTIPEAATRPFFERGISVGQVYGATETAPTAVVLRIDQAAQRPGSCGKAATLCDVRIVNDEGIDVAAGESGELWVRGPNILTSYWRNPDATSESLTDGWFHTGDIGHMDLDGWIYIDDRKKDVVISGGENIYPAELENILAESDLLLEATVVGVSDSRWGEIPVVVAVAAEGVDQNSQAVLQLFDGQIARFKHPKRVIWVDHLPRNVMGKVLKHEVRVLIASNETTT
ncbi:MAG: AMP-binding protein [Acidimicrobiales bacterium]|jgi:fatty-acyl-CoA synthase|nr:AMP-binding protein [Acidimicrobiales bacterium]MDP6902715.1 AMP-binding protein [Acidimicrobiales bacterium]